MSSVATLPLLWRARIAQSSALPTAADESASLLRDDSQGEACPTVSGLEAEHDRANIIKSSTLPHDSTPRVTSLVANKGKIASLKARIKMLKDKDRGVAEPSRDDATIKGRSLETRDEVGVDKKLATVSVPTVSGMVPTTSPIYTTARVVTPYSRRKGKEKMVESDTPKKKRLQEQIDEYEQFAEDLSIRERIELINDLVKYQDNYAKVLKYQSQQRKPLSKKQQREFYMSVLKSHSRWKTKHFNEEGERVKRKGLRFEQKSVKKVKTSMEVSEEDLKTMMQLVPVEEVYVEALQVKHPIIDWEIHTEGQRIYWKIIRLGMNTSVYQFFVYMLKHFDREDLNQLWTLVKETLSIRQATSDKEKEL
nr:hypothetical protein [Tanacetum cinerariifolium]